MTYLEVRKEIAGPVFSFLDVLKHFPEEPEQNIRMQLSRLTKRGLLKNLKRGLYIFEGEEIDELELANILYTPSYVSLETALNYHGLIPDVPLGVTSITTVTTKKIRTAWGQFYYQKIKPELFFGYKTVKMTGGGYANIAFPEKALLDYLYLHGEREADKLRLDKSTINQRIYDQFKRQF